MHIVSTEHMADHCIVKLRTAPGRKVLNKDSQGESLTFFIANVIRQLLSDLHSKLTHLTLQSVKNCDLLTLMLLMANLANIK